MENLYRGALRICDMHVEGIFVVNELAFAAGNDFKMDRHHAGMDHIQYLRGLERDIHDAPLHKGTAIIDTHKDVLAVLQVVHPHYCAEGQVFMGGGQGIAVIYFAIRRLFAVRGRAIPGCSACLIGGGVQLIGQSRAARQRKQPAGRKQHGRCRITDGPRSKRGSGRGNGILANYQKKTPVDGVGNT